MPYVKPESRPELNELISKMENKRVKITHLPWVLVGYCRKQIAPSYNNYKNFIGELRQCAAEIQRRHLPLRKLALEKIPTETLFINEIVDLMISKKIKADGDLNYILFKYCKYYTGDRKRFISALLRGAKEIEKELLALYEDEKIKENGDV